MGRPLSESEKWHKESQEQSETPQTENVERDIELETAETRDEVELAMDEMDVANDKTDMTVDKVVGLEIPIESPVNFKQVSHQNAYISISTYNITIGYVYDYISIIQINCKEDRMKLIDEALAAENEVKQSFSPKRNIALEKLQEKNKREALAAYKKQLSERFNAYTPINIMRECCREVSHQNAHINISSYSIG